MVEKAMATSDEGGMLSGRDVTRLLSDPSPAARAQTAEKIASQFGATSLSAKERALAEEIFRLMVRDAEIRVREALSANLKDNPLVPHDVACALANDVTEVATPMLEFSSVLTDEDLVEIVNSQGQDKMAVVARRSGLGEVVSEALVDRGDETVVATLVANDEAAISDGTLIKVVDRYGDNAKIQGPLVHRPTLPVTVAEKLVTRVSENLQSHLLANHKLPEGMATGIVLQSREKAVIGISRQASAAEVAGLVKQLRRNGRLTPSIVIRALCMGDLTFFEYAMADLADVPLVNARMLIHDGGKLGLKGIFQKAGMPDQLFPAVRAAINVFDDMEYDGRKNDLDRFSRRLIERVLTQYGDLGVEFETDDLEYLLGKMSQLPSDIAPDARA
ncbi:MAG: DUF2336 domain-containing protein [Rhodospirillaceae bacterium]